MDVELLKDTIRQELPGMLRDDLELRNYLTELMKTEFANKSETNDRFYELLAELRKDREERAHELDAQNLKWDEQNRKWEANHKELQRMNDAMVAMVQKHDRSIGALGSRWGLQSERAFRNALAGILEKSFGVQVLNVNEYDDEGTIFGRPDQVELDVIIKNGLLIVCELKSSFSKADMYIFERKVRFYERKRNRQATRMMVISPMIDARAQKVADRLGIETYGDSIEVESL